MNYHNFNSQDFAKDEYFINWVKNPDEAANIFWKEWLDKHPEQKKNITEARALVRAIDFNIPNPDKKQLNNILKAIHKEINR